MSPAHAPFLRAIWDAPHDDAPRLVYADFLEETGEPVHVARAEFIRLQCELARFGEFDDSPRRAKLAEREKELMKQHGRAWKEGLPQALQKAGFRRGFVFPRRQRYPGAKFLKLPKKAFDAAPTWDVSLTGLYRNFDRVFQSPLLSRVGILMIDLARYPHDATARLAECPHLRNVAQLELWNTHPTAASLAKLLDSDALPSLRELDLTTWALDSPMLRSLVDSRAAGRLSSLALSIAPPDPADGPLFPPERFPRLAALDLSNSDLGDPGVEALVARPAGTALRKLDLHFCGITDRGAELLANWPGAADLRWLDVHFNLFQAEGARALARSPYLGNLKYLCEDRFWLRDHPDVRAELEARFGKGLRYG